jgi:PTH1 family peptidyl-tRNA hydrolase
MCVDKIAEKMGATFSKQKCRAEIAEIRVGSEKVMLAKPQTYMNLSGESVIELVNFYKIEPKDVIVVYDDFDLSKGSIRIRESGSAGTHNGMRNIVALLGNSNFARIRIGFKPEGEFKIPLINYVLSGISEQDKPIYENVLDCASKAGVDFANGKTIQQIMQKYNGKAKA